VLQVSRPLIHRLARMLWCFGARVWLTSASKLHVPLSFAVFLSSLMDGCLLSRQKTCLWHLISSLPNRRCSWRRSYGTRRGTRCARVHGAILLDPPQLNAIRYAAPNDLAMIINRVPRAAAMRASIFVALSIACARVAFGQAPPADSLEQWVRRGYVLGTPESRTIWRELGWNGVGFGFRTFAARRPSTDASFAQSVDQFTSALNYYRIHLDELQTTVEGDIGLAWGVHTEVFQVKGQAPDQFASGSLTHCGGTDVPGRICCTTATHSPFKPTVVISAIGSRIMIHHDQRAA
jgi:hypothetical protein